jgi:hypothetical protein
MSLDYSPQQSVVCRADETNRGRIAVQQSMFIRKIWIRNVVQTYVNEPHTYAGSHIPASQSARKVLRFFNLWQHSP